MKIDVHEDKANVCECTVHDVETERQWREGCTEPPDKVMMVGDERRE
jgi:hypothetical protein